MTLGSSTNTLDMFEGERSVQISIDSLSRGIDNFHIFIRLSRRFSSDVKKLSARLISQLAVPKPKNWDNSNLYEKLREKYLDLMTALIHRVKTDFSADEICCLQLAPIKRIVSVTRSRLDDEFRKVNGKLAEHRNKGSSEALATQQRLFWLKKNYNPILYAVNKQLFAQLQKVEDRQLEPTREQFLGEDYRFVVDVILNPLLFTSYLSALPLLFNEDSMWSWNGEDSGFINLNLKVEELFNKRLKSHEIPPLRPANSNSEIASETHDELSGLFLTQNFLGKAADTQVSIPETFSWLENADNLESLFDFRTHAYRLKQIRKEEGLAAWWHASHSRDAIGACRQHSGIRSWHCWRSRKNWLCDSRRGNPLRLQRDSPKHCQNRHPGIYACPHGAFHAASENTFRLESGNHEPEMV